MGWKSGGKVSFSNYPTLRLDTPRVWGEVRYHCTDELLFSAFGVCLLTTFFYFRRKLKLHLKELRISTNGNVELDSPEGYRITRIKAVRHIITVKGEETKAKKCTEFTKDFFHITRTIEKSIPLETSMEIS